MDRHNAWISAHIPPLTKAANFIANLLETPIGQFKMCIEVTHTLSEIVLATSMRVLIVKYTISVSIEYRMESPIGFINKACKLHHFVYSTHIITFTARGQATHNWNLCMVELSGYYKPYEMALQGIARLMLLPRGSVLLFSTMHTLRWPWVQRVFWN